MRRQLFFSAVALICLGGITFCSWETPREIVGTIRMEAHGASSRTGRQLENVYAMDCVFLNISAPDLKPTISYDQLQQRQPACLGLGSVYRTVTLDQTINKGISVRLPVGASRKVQVIGVHSSTLGTACAGKTLAELFQEPVRPQLFVLGSTATDIFRDSSLTVNNTYVSGTTPDLAEICPTEKAGGETGDPGAPSAVRAVAILVSGTLESINPNLFSYAHENGAFRALDSRHVDGEPLSLAITPDRSLALGSMNDITSAAQDVFQLKLGLSGDDAGKFNGQALTGGIAASTTQTSSAITVAPLASGNYFYFRQEGSVAQGRYSTETQPTGMTPPAEPFPEVYELAATRNLVFSLAKSAGPTVKLGRLRQTASGQLTLEATSLLTDSGSNLTHPIWDSAGSRLIYTVENKIRYAAFSEVTGLTSSLNTITAAEFVTIYDTVYHPATRRLFAVGPDMAGTSTIVSARTLDENGTISPTVLLAQVELGTHEIEIHPDGNTLYGISRVAGTLRAYGINGTTLTGQGGQSIPSQPNHLSVLPLY